MPHDESAGPALTALTTRIVTAYLEQNQLPPDDLPGLIRSVHDALNQAGQEREAAAAGPARTPAVPVRKSVREDRIVCLECGWMGKTLRRHLAAAHGLTPHDYRARWNLPPEYPMISPDYAARRSDLARQIGLGSRAHGRGNGS
jgi:predicted transcriptional regulator